MFTKCHHKCIRSVVLFVLSALLSGDFEDRGAMPVLPAPSYEQRGWKCPGRPRAAIHPPAFVATRASTPSSVRLAAVAHLFFLGSTPSGRSRFSPQQIMRGPGADAERVGADAGRDPARRVRSMPGGVGQGAAVERSQCRNRLCTPIALVPAWLCRVRDRGCGGLSAAISAPSIRCKVVAFLPGSPPGLTIRPSAQRSHWAVPIFKRQRAAGGMVPPRLSCAREGELFPTPSSQFTKSV